MTASLNARALVIPDLSYHPLGLNLPLQSYQSGVGNLTETYVDAHSFQFSLVESLKYSQALLSLRVMVIGMITSTLDHSGGRSRFHF